MFANVLQTVQTVIMRGATVICVYILVLGVTAVDGREIFVSSTSGNDTQHCGSSDQPCASIRYAAGLSQHNDLVSVRAGVYSCESDVVALQLNHSLLIRGSRASSPADQVTIVCPANHTYNKLYQIGNDSTLTLENIHVINCTVEGGDLRTAPSQYRLPGGLIDADSGSVKLQNCVILNSGRLIHHSSLSPAQNITSSSDELVTVILINSTFTSSADVRVMSIVGASSVNVVIHQCTFDRVGIRLATNNHTRLDIQDSLFTHTRHLSGAAAVDVTMATNTNLISLSRCTFYNIRTNMVSTVQFAIDSTPLVPPSIHLTDCSFINNRGTLVNGGALTFVARFGDREPQLMKAKLQNCTFTGNRNDGGCGGGVYISGVQGVTMRNSTFASNTAATGGAVCVYRSSNILLTQCKLSENTAKNRDEDRALTRGGALLVSESDCRIEQSNFTNNLATFEGSAVYAVNQQQKVAIDGCVFEQNVNYNGSIITMRGNFHDDPSIEAIVFSHIVMNTTGNGYGSHILLLEGDLKVTNAQLKCPPQYNSLVESNALSGVNVNTARYEIYSYRCVPAATVTTTTTAATTTATTTAATTAAATTTAATTTAATTTAATTTASAATTIATETTTNSATTTPAVTTVATTVAAAIFTTAVTSLAATVATTSTAATTKTTDATTKITDATTKTTDATTHMNAAFTTGADTDLHDLGQQNLDKQEVVDKKKSFKLWKINSPQSTTSEAFTTHKFTEQNIHELSQPGDILLTHED